MAKLKKVPISERAILARINRKLDSESRGVRKCRENSPGFATLGHYYLLDKYKNVVVDTQLDLESFSRMLGVLAEHEVVVHS